MPIQELNHIDLAVGDLRRSLDFYLAVFGPLGCVEDGRYPSYRGTEEVVYLQMGPSTTMGLRQADGGRHDYYGVGIEHFAVFVDRREEVDETYARLLEMGARIHFPPEPDNDLDGYWAVFFFDPDGMRVEVAHWPRG